MVDPKGQRRKDESREYRALLDAVHGRGEFRDPGDVYQSLMAKERRVLDTVDRVVNDAVRTETDTLSFVQLPLHEVGIRAIAAARSLFADLMESRRPADFAKAVMKEDRKVYLGVILIMVAACIAIVDALE
jgi:hypothetical protein